MSITNGPLTQVSWVTDDLDATERVLTEQFGVGVWTRIPGVRFGPDTCTFRGRPCDATADVSMAYSGDLQLELIRPVSGESVWSEFLAQHGTGLHHVCFRVPDLAEATSAASAEGIEVLMTGSMAGPMEFAYLDCSAFGAPYVELARISPEMDELFAAIKAAG
ncbi:MAG TPA: VOC family protein [Nocardioides sp.]|nr:VOC family protein [Nocardioides sp.]